MSATALWHVAPRRAELRRVKLPPTGPEQARVRTLWSAVSRGTERLVFEGRVPASEAQRMRAPRQEGEFSFPVKYGYCAVGRVEEGPDDLLGRTVFALHPHEDVFVAPVSELTAAPDHIPPRRVALAALMETALNGVWDSGAGPGDRIAVVGAGAVGLLIAALCARLPGAQVTVVDLDPARAPVAQKLGARFLVPDAAKAMVGRADVVFHASASSQGLATALSLGGLEAAIVEMSWYGAGEVEAPLGEAFHSRRLKLVSSQVGHVAPCRRSRWPAARRLAKAIDLLDDDRLDALIVSEVAFADLPQALPGLFSPHAPGLVTLVRYPAVS